MHLLNQLEYYARQFPERIAVQSGEESLTWRDLKDYSDRLALWILKNQPAAGGPAQPVAVYGHKHPWVLACFLACVKTGHAYCPIDTSVPGERTAMILEQLPSHLLFAPEEHSGSERSATLAETGKQVITQEELETVFLQPSAEVPPVEHAVSGTGTWYMIFTSGSTGRPKGVQISADCLEHFLDWSVRMVQGSDSTDQPENFCPGREKLVFLNQAPFSFDLSVMDVYTCLAMGGTLWCLDKKTQSNYAALMQSLERSGANVWVSTPSFAQMCLSERSFGKDRMPSLRTFLFCGETLDNRMTKKLMERFPDAVIYNTYGPTESTVAVTGVRITEEMALAREPLPVGTAKPGTQIRICDPSGNVLPDGEKGEIIIIGDTVSSGYYRQKELTEKAFFTVPDEDGTPLRAYHTGDEGWLQDGMLHYCGRIDFQIKLHGYRIELEDIENNLRRIPGIVQAVVLPNERGGKVSSLTAFVTLDHSSLPDSLVPDDYLKEQLARLVPSYMIPKKFEILDAIPVTPNGKADRRALAGMAAERKGGSL